MKRSYSTVNSCYACQPLGAVMAFRGVEKSMTLLHGSQGCSTYIRLHLCHHFKEPLDVASSSLNEKEAVYGGAKNLKRGLKNVIEKYEPKMIGVATTCLAETIGDDVGYIINDFTVTHSPKTGIVWCSTPSFAGSHLDGFSLATLSLVENFAKKTRANNKVNLFTTAGLSCADVRYLKDIFKDFELGVIVLPDISDTFEAPYTKSLKKLPDGGTQLKEIKDTANSFAGISLGTAMNSTLAGDYLQNNYGVKNNRLSLPVGLRKTDTFFSLLSKISGNKIPAEIKKERGRLLDAYIDCHKHTFGVKVAIIGDQDIAAGLVSIAVETGLEPALIACGSGDKNFVKEVKYLTARLDRKPVILNPTDFETIHEHAKALGIQLLIGPSTASFISEEEGIPLIRIGFPVHDRFGAQRKLLAGYQGAIYLIDEITNTILEHGLKKPVKELKEYV